MTHTIDIEATVDEQFDGQRLDQIAARLFADWSRSRLQAWIRSGALTVDGQRRRPRDILYAGARLHLSAQPEPDERWSAQAIELPVVHADNALLVIDKPAGLVVHPAAGHRDGTLVNALLHHFPELAALPRAGIVHRLDKDTSGLLVVARTLAAHKSLVEQLQARSVHRQYEALVRGEIGLAGSVDAPVGRHPRQRQKMAVVERGGKAAVTHYRPLERLAGCTRLRCLLETGRTHQIRVHMASIRHPLVGDPLYGGRSALPASAPVTARLAVQEFPRQALHARRLELHHPESGDPVSWESPLPADMQTLFAALADAGQTP